MLMLLILIGIFLAVYAMFGEQIAKALGYTIGFLSTILITIIGSLAGIATYILVVSIATFLVSLLR